MQGNWKRNAKRGSYAHVGVYRTNYNTTTVAITANKSLKITAYLAS